MILRKIDRLCAATNNRHKLEEIRDIINIDIILLSLEEIGCFEELPETRTTLEGNSLQKAEYVFGNYGVPCFADDTGLEVEALNGEPGVFSARYAGDEKNSDDNIDLLLKKLSATPNRNARFRTVVTLVGIVQSPVFFEGFISGTIIKDRRGGSGFGYDPIFVPVGNDKTFAEMTLQEKSQLSHRAIAIKKLESYLKGVITAG
jgi:XTP/dITP diphosphohydrolase